MIKNAKLSGYYFYMNLNIQGDFQICISVPLKQAFFFDFLSYYYSNFWYYKLLLFYGRLKKKKKKKLGENKLRKIYPNNQEKF